jgi:hypothetical protein
MTTGDYGIASFTVTIDGGSTEAPKLSLEPTTISASRLQDSTAGAVLSGTAFTPGVSLTISLRNGDWKRSAFVEGAEIRATVSEDGSFTTRLVTLEQIAAGSYTVWVTGGVGTFAYDLKVPLTVTASMDPTSTDPTAAPPQQRPESDSPAAPAPSPSPPAVEPPVDDAPVVDDEQHGFGVQEPAPVTR